MTLNETNFEGVSCPLPLSHKEQIVMGHGSGGKMTSDLIKSVFFPYLSNQGPLLEGNDFASLGLPHGASLTGHLAISTDSHIVKPLSFPGGDIGRLAVCGTVNDVAMSGAEVLYLTAGFILEEGFPISQLEIILQSMQKASQEANVLFVAGDTKVVENGLADGLYITTTGVGWIPPKRCIAGNLAKPGDAILISGTMGDHGIAVLAERGELNFQTDIQSDVAPLNNLIAALLQVIPDVHVLRDPTRGGLATTLNEIAHQSKVGMMLDEQLIPIRPQVRAACEMLGFDPLYIANEGKVIIVLPEKHAATALNVLHDHLYGQDAAIIGHVTEAPPSRVLLRTRIGGTRLLDVLAGEMLPRIC